MEIDFSQGGVFRRQEGGHLRAEDDAVTREVVEEAPQVFVDGFFEGVLASVNVAAVLLAFLEDVVEGRAGGGDDQVAGAEECEFAGGLAMEWVVVNEGAVAVAAGVERVNEFIEGGTVAAVMEAGVSFPGRVGVTEAKKAIAHTQVSELGAIVA